MKLLPKVLIVATIPILFGITMMLILTYLLSAQEDELRRERNARAAVSAGMSLTAAMTSGAMALTQYSSSQMQRPIAPYFAAKNRARKAIADLKILMADRPQQIEQVKKVESECEKTFAYSDECIKLIRMGGLSFAPMRLRELRELIESEVLFDQLDTEIEGISQPNEAHATITVSDYRQLINIVLYGGSASAILLSILLPLLLSKQVTSRLNVIIENSKRLARRAPLLNPVSGKDEIAELDQQFHVMVHQLEEVTSQERAIMDNAGAIILTFDHDTKVLEIGLECEKLLQYSVQDLLGRRLLSIIPSDSMETFRANLESIQKNASERFEQIILRRDGQPLTMVLNIRRTDEERFYCVAYDITERKILEDKLALSEARIRAVVENLPAGLCLVDSAGMIQFANSNALKLFGELNLEDMADKSFLPKFKFGDQGNFRDVIAQHVGKTFISEVSVGSNRTPVELSLDEAELSGEQFFLAIAADLSERLAIDRIKEQILLTMSDDIAQPMHQIAKTLQRLEAGELGDVTDKAKGRLQVSIKESDRLLKLFEDFLRIPVSDDLFVIEKKFVSAKALIDRAIAAVSYKASGKEVSVLFDSEMDFDINVDGDRIVQVLVNLLTNAIKFSPAMKTIFVRGERVFDSARFSVIDEGSGVPENALSSIFEPFKQTQISDATRKGGTGLGLAICKTIVEKHGGAIGVENNPDGGATFYFAIPVS